MRLKKETSEKPREAAKHETTSGRGLNLANPGQAQLRRVPANLTHQLKRFASGVQKKLLTSPEGSGMLSNLGRWMKVVRAFRLLIPSAPDIPCSTSLMGAIWDDFQTWHVHF
jgi:hypothetical protein